MSSILTAQRRHQPDEAVSLVAPSRVNPLVLALISSGLTLALGALALWWWMGHQQPENQVITPAVTVAPVNPPVLKVSTIEPNPLAFELMPLPEFNDLKKVDLLTLRQQRFDQLLAQQTNQTEIVEGSPNAPTSNAVAERTVQQAPIVTPQKSQPLAPADDANLAERFAAAVEATQVLEWQEETDTVAYDEAPMLGALSPEMQKLVPAITFNSHVFSSDPARRYVTFNNKQLLEGDLLNNNIEIVAIRLDDVVLRVAGHLCRLKALSDWG
ncbi:general secretion pathway protein GspB [Agarivorans sp. MS3-6]